MTYDSSCESTYLLYFGVDGENCNEFFYNSCNGNYISEDNSVYDTDYVDNEDGSNYYYEYFQNCDNTDYYIFQEY